MTIDHAKLRERVEQLRTRITMAGAEPGAVRIVAVTKKFDVDVIDAAMQCGLADIGENYAQEASDKYARLAAAGKPQPSWHFIGRLQRNKVRMLASFVTLWQTVDSEALVGEIAKRAPGAAVLLQVNLSGEGGRGGCEWGGVDLLLEGARSAGLDVRGLMGVGPAGGPEDSRAHFRRLAETARRLQLAEVSMGMSGDLEVAVQEGATIVRVGSALFGDRPLSLPNGD